MKLNNILKCTAIACLVLLMVTVAFPPRHAEAQVTLSSVQGPNFSLNNAVFATNKYPTVTVTGAGNATFNIGSVSCLVVRAAGTFTVSNLALQVSNDNTNFTTIKLSPLGTVGAANTANVSAIVAPGFFVANVGGMTQAKLVETGAITGTSVILTVTGTSNMCTTYAAIN